MDAKVALGIGISVGALVGSVATYLALDKRYEAMIEEEVAQYRDYISKSDRYRNEPEQKDVSPCEDVKPKVERPPHKTVDYTSFYRDKCPALEGISAMMDCPPDDEPEDEDEEDEPELSEMEEGEAESEAINAEMSGERRLIKIKERDLLYGEPDFDKVTILWHNADDVLVDDRGKMLEDQTIFDEIGFREYLGSHDEMFVRSPSERTDYDIVKDPSAYSDDPDITII